MIKIKCMKILKNKNRLYRENIKTDSSSQAPTPLCPTLLSSGTHQASQFSTCKIQITDQAEHTEEDERQTTVSVKMVNVLNQCNV